MNKKELIEELAKKAKCCSKAEAARCLNAFVDIVRGVLKRGGKVVIAGFGTFSVKGRKARAGVNPQTGARIQIPAMRVPKFKAGKGLKKAVK
ncbi:HU family DNA-binding protein [Patescibacteria group bacterium]|nr:HU family DNA-binding protein [Patescibacteria group bacterium]